MTLSASLAAAVLGAAPAAAQGTFRDDGSVIVNRNVLDSLEPRLKRPAPGSTVKLKPPGNTSKTEAPKAKTAKAATPAPQPAKIADSAKTPESAKPPAEPAKAADAAPAKPQPAKTAEPQPAKTAEPQSAKSAETAKTEMPKPSSEPVKIAEPAKPAMPAPTRPDAAKPDAAPQSRLVGPLTEPNAGDKLAAPILPQADVTRTLPSAAATAAPATGAAQAPLATPGQAPTASAPAPSASAPSVPASSAPAPSSRMAAVTPPATGRGLVTPQAPAAQPPAAKSEPATSQAGRGAALEQRDGTLRLLFAANEATLPADAQKALESIARRLESEHNLYIQLLAYAEGTEDEASKARRLSLSRALAVRSYLMNDGVRSTRIEVRALGHKVPDGPADRVDVVIDKRY